MSSSFTGEHSWGAADEIVNRLRMTVAAASGGGGLITGLEIESVVDERS